MEDVTGSMICKQIRNSYSGYLITALLFVALFGFCTTFCGRELGTSDILTIIMLVLTAAALLLTLTVLHQIIAVRKHRVFRRYGDADTLAERIRDGARHPYFQTPPDRKPGLLITERFIVSDMAFHRYLELADVRCMQRCKMSDQMQPMPTHAGNAPEFVISMLFQKWLRNQYNDYRKRHPVPDTVCSWQLYLWDDKGHKYSYAAAPADIDAVTAALQTLVPDIRQKPTIQR